MPFRVPVYRLASTLALILLPLGIQAQTPSTPGVAPAVHRSTAELDNLAVLER
jgi:hypothetical protein